MVGRPDPRPAGGPVASLPATPRDADGPRGPSRAVSRVGASALRPWALVLCDARAGCGTGLVVSWGLSVKSRGARGSPVAAARNSPRSPA